MHAAMFLQDLAVVMIVAGLVTVLFHRFGQPVVLGYILAGVIIGPHTPPFPLIHDEHTTTTLSELGLILLMFSLGLEFSLRKLKKVGASAFIAAFLEILLMVWVGYEIGQLFGWSNMDSLFLGAILSISSTTIIIKALSDLGKTKERFAELIFGILIIEDILGIAMIALLSGIAMTGALSLGEVGVTLGKLTIFLVITLVVGLIAVPRFIGYVARFKSNEMLLVTVLGLCFGVSLLALKLGYSVALGAFVIGAVIAEARQIHQIERLIEPVRDMFSAVFFVSIGLLIDPKVLMQYWVPVLIISLAVVIGKVITCSLGAFLGGNDLRTSLRVGTGLAQIGEFSFIIAALGLSFKVTSEFLYPVAVAVSVITTLLTPYLIKSSDRFVSLIDRLAPKRVVSALEIYTQWVGQFGARRHPDLAKKMIRKAIGQMVLNVAFISGIFIVAAFAGKHREKWWPWTNWGPDALNSILWVGALLLSLPMVIATARKLQALGMIIAETRVSDLAAGAKAEGIRTIISQIVPIGGSLALGLFILVLSSTLLPTFRLLLVLIGCVCVIAWLLRRSFIRIYSKAQFALEETFQNPPPDYSGTTMLRNMLRDASLASVALNQNSPAAGKFIHELALRTESGASIVGIDRNGTNLINPGPEEELKAGDHLLLLGTKGQLDKAREVLGSVPISNRH